MASIWAQTHQQKAHCRCKDHEWIIYSIVIPIPPQDTFRGETQRYIKQNYTEAQDRTISLVLFCLSCLVFRWNTKPKHKASRPLQSWNNGGEDPPSQTQLTFDHVRVHSSLSHIILMPSTRSCDIMQCFVATSIIVEPLTLNFSHQPSLSSGNSKDSCNIT